MQKLVVLTVVFAGFLAYHNIFSAPFVFDDIPHISENPHIRQLWPPWDVLSHSSRPVVHLSLAVNCAMGGLNPWGYHLFNVVVHILVALTLYGVVRRTLLSESLRPTFGQAASSLAGTITLIWLVHPLQTESVTFTVQRGESLMSLFYLLTLYCMIRSDGASQGNLWKIGAVVSCVLGMGCKPVMATAPLVTLLYDRAFLAKSWCDVMQRRGWLYAGLAATWLLLPPLLVNAPTEWETSAGFEFKGIPPLQYARMESVAILRYLRLAFWPHPLCLDYGWGFQWQAIAQAGHVLPDLMVVLALLAGTVWAWNRNPSLGFLGAWFFLILAPTSSFIPIADPIAEHRMYLPLAAVVTAMVFVAFVFGQRFLRNHSGSVLRCVACGFVVVPLAVLTIQRNRDYISAVAIWDDTLAKRPQNPRAHYNLGIALAQTGRTEEFIRQYEQALRLKPDFAGTLLALGVALEKLGRSGDAIQHYEEALRINPDYAEAHKDIGAALYQTGKREEAMEHFQQALRINPDYADVHCALGMALEQAGKTQEAIEHLEQAVRTKPDYAEAHYNLGLALGQAGEVGEAIGHLEQALRIKPDYAEAHCNLGIALARLGRLQEAVGHWVRALQINPDYAEAHYNLGLALGQAGEVGEAIGHLEQALRIKPDYAEAHYNLGIALARLGRLQEAVGHWEQALQIKPDYAEVYNSLGTALAQTGKIEEAIAHYERALRIKPDYAEVHYNLGNALARVGRVPEAIVQYEQALRIRPDFTLAQNALARLQAGQ
jgi:tetratricopeptide (TPR) repeat protein